MAWELPDTGINHRSEQPYVCGSRPHIPHSVALAANTSLAYRKPHKPAHVGHKTAPPNASSPCSSDESTKMDRILEPTHKGTNSEQSNVPITTTDTTMSASRSPPLPLDEARQWELHNLRKRKFLEDSCDSLTPDMHLKSNEECWGSTRRPEENAVTTEEDPVGLQENSYLGDSLQGTRSTQMPENSCPTRILQDHVIKGAGASHDGRTLVSKADPEEVTCSNSDLTSQEPDPTQSCLLTPSPLGEATNHKTPDTSKIISKTTIKTVPTITTSNKTRAFNVQDKKADWCVGSSRNGNNHLTATKCEPNGQEMTDHRTGHVECATCNQHPTSHTVIQDWFDLNGNNRILADVKNPTVQTNNRIEYNPKDNAVCNSGCVQTVVRNPTLPVNFGIVLAEKDENTLTSEPGSKNNKMAEKNKVKMMEVHPMDTYSLSEKTTLDSGIGSMDFPVFPSHQKVEMTEELHQNPQSNFDVPPESNNDRFADLTKYTARGHTNTFLKASNDSNQGEVAMDTSKMCDFPSSAVNVTVHAVKDEVFTQDTHGRLTSSPSCHKVVDSPPDLHVSKSPAPCGPSYLDTNPSRLPPKKRRLYYEQDLSVSGCDPDPIRSTPELESANVNLSLPVQLSAPGCQSTTTLPSFALISNFVSSTPEHKQDADRRPANDKTGNLISQTTDTDIRFSNTTQETRSSSMPETCSDLCNGRSESGSDQSPFMSETLDRRTPQWRQTLVHPVQDTRFGSNNPLPERPNRTTKMQLTSRSVAKQEPEAPFLLSNQPPEDTHSMTSRMFASTPFNYPRMGYRSLPDSAQIASILSQHSKPYKSPTPPPSIPFVYSHHLTHSPTPTNLQIPVIHSVPQHTTFSDFQTLQANMQQHHHIHPNRIIYYPPNIAHAPATGHSPNTHTNPNILARPSHSLHQANSVFEKLAQIDLKASTPPQKIDSQRMVTAETSTETRHQMMDVGTQPTDLSMKNVQPDSPHREKYGPRDNNSLATQGSIYRSDTCNYGNLQENAVTSSRYEQLGAMTVGCKDKSADSPLWFATSPDESKGMDLSNHWDGGNQTNLRNHVDINSNHGDLRDHKDTGSDCLDLSTHSELRQYNSDVKKQSTLNNHRSHRNHSKQRNASAPSNPARSIRDLRDRDAPLSSHTRDQQPPESSNDRVKGHRSSDENPRNSEELEMATKADEDGDLPLHIAVVQNEARAVQVLVEVMKSAKVTLDYHNNLKQTPLHLATITKLDAIVKILLEAGASPNVPDRKGQTCCHLAVNNQTPECLQTILSHSTLKVDLSAKNYEGLTALHRAVQLGDLECLKLLLDHGADLDQVDGKSGKSPLYLAFECNQPQAADLLLARGANVNIPTYSGCTVLQAVNTRGQHLLSHLMNRMAEGNGGSQGSRLLSRANRSKVKALYRQIQKEAGVRKTVTGIAATQNVTTQKL